MNSEKNPIYTFRTIQGNKWRSFFILKDLPVPAFSKCLKFYGRNWNKDLSYCCNDVCKIDGLNDLAEIYRKASVPDSVKFRENFRKTFFAEHLWLSGCQEMTQKNRSTWKGGVFYQACSLPKWIRKSYKSYKSTTIFSGILIKVFNLSLCHLHFPFPNRMLSVSTSSNASSSNTNKLKDLMYYMVFQLLHRKNYRFFIVLLWWESILLFWIFFCIIDCCSQ